MKTATIFICCLLALASSFVRSDDAAAAEKYDLINLNKSPGLLYTQLHRLLFVQDELKIVVRAATHRHRDQVADLKKSHAVVEKLCSIKGCGSSKRMNFLYTTAVEKADNYYQMTASSSDTIAHVIKGPVDEEFILGVDQGDKNEGVILTEATIARSNATLAPYDSLKRLYAKNVELADDADANTDRIKNDPEVGKDIDDHVHAIMLLSLELDKEFTALTDAVDYCQRGMVHPEVMTAPTFLDELMKASDAKPKEIRFPFELLPENTHNLLRQVITRGYVYKDNLMVVLHVPTVQNLDYDLYNVLPMPVRSVDDAFVYIQPTVGYLAVDRMIHIHYVTMENLNRCSTLNATLTMCPPSDVYSTKKQPICETELLSGVDKIPASCDVRVTPNKLDIFQRIGNSDNWAFVKSQPEEGRYACRQPIHGGSNDMEKVTVADSGVIGVKKHCIYYGRSTYLIPTTSVCARKAFVSMEQMPSIVTDDCCNEKAVKARLTDVKHKQLSNINLNNIYRVSYKLSQTNA